MVTALAPAKVILFGEHAVVYGEPALAAAIDLETRVTLRPSKTAHTTVNGHPLSEHHHAHILHALHVLEAPPFEVETASRIPSAAGLGSSAALAVATAAAVLEATARFSPEVAARTAYEAEWRAQGGRGSPTDTSTVAAGGGVLVDRKPGPAPLWTIERGERVWHLRRVELPPVTVVVGNTLERGRTADEVTKVARFARMQASFAKGVFREIGEVCLEGADALVRGDLPAAGRAMDRDQRLLAILGVSTSKLDRLCHAAAPFAHGTKLTGSGGGGSMIALAKDADRCAEAIRRAGGEPYIATLGARGVRTFPGEA